MRWKSTVGDHDHRAGDADPQRLTSLAAYPNLEADIAITTHGSDWYWAVTAVMTVSTFIFIGLALTKPRQHRIFHYITASITMVASIAYFTMGSNLGWTAINVEFQRNDPVVRGVDREIFYVRYIGKCSCAVA